MAPVGPRTKQCGCGHLFGIKAEEVADGEWSNHLSNGLNKVPNPKPLSTEKLSDEEIRDLVSYHGLGFCIYYYISPKNVADPETAKLIKIAKDAMQKVQQKVYNG